MHLSFDPRTWPAPLLAAIVFALAAATTAAWAVQSGFGARVLGILDRTVDTEVVVLFVPLCAIVFAIVGEAVRIASSGEPPERAAPRRRLPRGWQPGHGEG